MKTEESEEDGKEKEMKRKPPFQVDTCEQIEWKGLGVERG